MALKKETPQERRARRDAALKNVLAKIKLDAARHVNKVINGQHADSTAPWKEVTGETRASLILTQAALSEERVVKAAGVAPRSFGVVVINQKLPAKEWEAKVIETKETLRGLPETEVQQPTEQPELSRELSVRGSIRETDEGKGDRGELQDATFAELPGDGLKEPNER